MLENLYTTKMSTNKKTLQKRFTKIRSKSGRISRIMAAVMSAVIALTMFGATIVMAAIDAVDKKITVYCADKKLEFVNKPFFFQNTAYVPLREIFQKLGINCDEDTMAWDNGKIIINLKGYIDCYEINIGDNKIIYNNKNHEINSHAVREESFAPILMNDTAYIPFEYIDCILNRDDNHYDVYYTFADINSKRAYLNNAENFTYPDICRLQYVIDNGHFPWRLDAQQVIKIFLKYTFNDENGEIINFTDNGAEYTAECVVKGEPYTIRLFKPINKTKTGIWIVKSFEKNT